VLIKRGSCIFALGIILTVVCASVDAQQTVYKWVDEDGVVHFGEEPPGESPDVEVEVFTTDAAPTYVPPAQTTIKSPSAAETHVKSQSAQPKIQRRPPVKEIDITEMSLADLDRRCEDVRDAKIAPLKEAEIANCIQTETGDQAWCETFWADYGAPRRMASGGLTPRLFHDLPECTEAWDERNRRGLNP
jgi:Domain of unknown function (DUF4124)